MKASTRMPLPLGRTIGTPVCMLQPKEPTHGLPNSNRARMLTPLIATSDLVTARTLRSPCRDSIPLERLPLNQCLLQFWNTSP